jgi:hypothetical protein
MTQDARRTAQDAGHTTLPEIQKNWQKILRHLQKVLKQTSASALAREGQPMDLSDTVLTLGFSKRHGFHMSGTQQNGPKISQAIQEVMGVRLRIVVQVVDDAGGDAGRNDASGNAQESEPVQHPLLNDVMTMFDGTIVQDDQDPWEE